MFLITKKRNENFYYLLCSCTNPIFGQPGPQNIGENALSQPDCRIFESTISPEQIDETGSFFRMIIQTHKN